MDDTAWIWLLFFTGSGSSPILADPVARRTFVVPERLGILVPRREVVVVPAAALAVQV